MRKNFIKILMVVISISVFSQEISVEKAVEMAKENSSNLKSKTLEINSSSNLLKSGKSSYMPTVTASSNISKSENSDSNYGSSISLTQSIFKGGEIVNSVKSAELTVELKIEELKTLIKEKEKETVNLYISVLKSENQLQVYKSSLEELKKEYEKEKIMFDKNMSSKLDMMNIEISISSAEENIYIAEAEYKKSLEKLKKDIGLNSSEEIKIINIAAEKSEINLENDIKNYMENSSYIKQKNIEKEIYKSEIKIAKAAYYPDINLTLKYSSETNSFDSWNWNAGVGFSYTIWDSGKRKAVKDNAEIDFKKYEIESKSEIEDKIIEIKSKYEELKSYEKVVESRREKVKKMEEKFEITKIKYDNRYIGSDDYLKDENELQEMKISAMNAEMEYVYKISEYKSLLQ